MSFISLIASGQPVASLEARDQNPRPADKVGIVKCVDDYNLSFFSSLDICIHRLC
jgi:hypothetical protein